MFASRWLASISTARRTLVMAAASRPEGTATIPSPINTINPAKRRPPGVAG